MIFSIPKENWENFFKFMAISGLEVSFRTVRFFNFYGNSDFARGFYSRKILNKFNKKFPLKFFPTFSSDWMRIIAFLKRLNWIRKGSCFSRETKRGMMMNKKGRQMRGFPDSTFFAKNRKLGFWSSLETIQIILWSRIHNIL